MNSTRNQSSNKFAKAIAVLSASTLLSCSAVVLLFSQAAMSQQSTSEANQLLAQNGGAQGQGNDSRGGSDGLDGRTPSGLDNVPSSPNATPSSGGSLTPGGSGMNTPMNRGNVEDRQELSPRLSDDPNAPVNRQEGTPPNSVGVEQRQELSPRLSDDPRDPAVNRTGGTGTLNNSSVQQRQELSPRLTDDPNANDDPTNRMPGQTGQTPGRVMTPGGASSQQPFNQNTTPSPSYNQNTSPSYNQNNTPSYNRTTTPSYNQNTGSSSEPVRGLW